MCGLVGVLDNTYSDIGTNEWDGRYCNGMYSLICFKFKYRLFKNTSLMQVVVNLLIQQD